MTKGIYAFHWDCGRNGDVEGVFIATAEDVENIIGKDIYFGEILGKHSEVYGRIKEGDIVLKTDDAAFVALWEEKKFGSTGYNPFDYLQDKDNEE